MARTKKSMVKVVDMEQTLEVVGGNKSKKDKKIRFQYLLKQLEKKVILKENQLIYAKKIESNTITLVQGPAGTSKTWTACYTLLKLLFQEKIDRIIFTKPIKESGENLGFLPGDIDQKMQPYVESFLYTCKEMIGEDNINFLVESKYIELRPLAYLRGLTFNKSVMFMDEAQNCLFNQLILYITRLGEGSKVVLAGDVTQRDIEKKQVVFPEFIEMIKDVPSVAIHEFKKEDIIRNPILIQITEKYEQWKESKNL